MAKGGSRAIYTISEEVVRGVFELMTDPIGTLEVLATMVSQPVDTGYQIGKMIANSYNRDVIHGDAESRTYWFVYAFGNVFGLKGLGNLGKSGATAAQKGVQKAEKKLDELLPYHPKHQVALVGPVPFNVFNGGFFLDRLVMMTKRIPGSLGGMSAGGRKVGKGNSVRNFTSGINAKDIPNMSKKDILDNLPNNWNITDNNGFVHIRDGEGNIRMRIDPPDKMTPYDHVHIYDKGGNPLDINLNKVDRKSLDAHIPYKK